jgi:hypothetical protein
MFASGFSGYPSPLPLGIVGEARGAVKRSHPKCLRAAGLPGGRARLYNAR